jgi:hypothetical protein
MVRRHGPGRFRPCVFGFKFLQAFGLVNPYATVFLAPAVEGLPGDAQQLDHLGDGPALALQDFGFAQFANDCLGGVSFSRHDPVSLAVENTNLEPGPVFSDQASVLNRTGKADGRCPDFISMKDESRSVK